MADLSKANDARLAACLAKRYRFEGDAIMTLGAWLDLQRQAGPVEKSEGDGMIDWSRTKFNRMDNRQQSDYEAGLRARKYYYLNGLVVPKIVFDAE